MLITYVIYIELCLAVVFIYPLIYTFQVKSLRSKKLAILPKSIPSQSNNCVISQTDGNIQASAIKIENSSRIDNIIIAKDITVPQSTAVFEGVSKHGEKSVEEQHNALPKDDEKTVAHVVSLTDVAEVAIYIKIHGVLLQLSRACVYTNVCLPFFMVLFEHRL